jgi:hypothetical protein
VPKEGLAHTEASVVLPRAEVAAVRSDPDDIVPVVAGMSRVALVVADVGMSPVALVVDVPEAVPRSFDPGLERVVGWRNCSAVVWEPADAVPGSAVVGTGLARGLERTFVAAAAAVLVVLVP